MARLALPDIDRALQRYKENHRGRVPLYILLSPSDADFLMEQVRMRERWPEGVTVTEYNGAKLVRHEGVPEGEVQLSDELPGIAG
ncbi:hypothetical protein AWW69_09760 [Bacillus cereus]|nr:hypothetical protein AWW69_09760 [Bacillus cereus]